MGGKAKNIFSESETIRRIKSPKSFIEKSNPLFLFLVNARRPMPVRGLKPSPQSTKQWMIPMSYGPVPRPLPPLSLPRETISTGSLLRAQLVFECKEITQ